VSDDSTTQCLLFPGIFRKPVVAQFDQQEGSSDGGALLLKAANQHYRLVEELTACLRDERQDGKVDHTLQDLVAQRVFSIACGYPDGNDSARMGGDPIHKLLLDRDPIEGHDLASQPTVSRFENAVGVKELYRMGETLARSVIRRHAKRLRRRVYRVTLDLDPTDDPTHGAQQLSFFNGHYDSWCYLPVMGFISFNEEAEQYLCAAVLRPGNAPAAVGAVGLLRRLIRMLRGHFPGVIIRVRLDGGFASPAVLEFLEEQSKLEYVVAMAKNAVLKRIAAPGIRRARQLSESSGKTEHIYGDVERVQVPSVKASSRSVASVAIHRATGGCEAYTARKQAVRIQLRNRPYRCDADAVSLVRKAASGSDRYGEVVPGSPESLARGMLPRIGREPRRAHHLLPHQEERLLHREVRAEGDRRDHGWMDEQSYDPIVPVKVGNRRASVRSGHGTHWREGGNKQRIC
jgi:hypothetical protein